MKKLLKLFALSALAASVVGCGGGDTTSTPVNSTVNSTAPLTTEQKIANVKETLALMIKDGDRLDNDVSLAKSISNSTLNVTLTWSSSSEVVVIEESADKLTYVAVVAFDDQEHDVTITCNFTIDGTAATYTADVFIPREEDRNVQTVASLRNAPLGTIADIDLTIVYRIVTPTAGQYFGNNEGFVGIDKNQDHIYVSTYGRTSGRELEIGDVVNVKGGQTVNYFGQLQIAGNPNNNEFVKLDVLATAEKAATPITIAELATYFSANLPTDSGFGVPSGYEAYGKRHLITGYLNKSGTNYRLSTTETLGSDPATFVEIYYKSLVSVYNTAELDALLGTEVTIDCYFYTARESSGVLSVLQVVVNSMADIVATA